MAAIRSVPDPHESDDRHDHDQQDDERLSVNPANQLARCGLHCAVVRVFPGHSDCDPNPEPRENLVTSDPDQNRLELHPCSLIIARSERNRCRMGVGCIRITSVTGSPPPPVRYSLKTKLRHSANSRKKKLNNAAPLGEPVNKKRSEPEGVQVDRLPTPSALPLPLCPKDLLPMETLAVPHTTRTLGSDCRHTPECRQPAPPRPLSHEAS